MKTHKVRSNRRGKGPSIQRRVVISAILLLVPAMAVASFVMSSASSTTPEQALARSSQPEEAGAPDATSDAKVATSSERPTADCRYSIVPGGVHSSDEVRAAIARDAVVAAHYRVLKVESLREEPAAEGRRVFVSYRIGDEVYWSRERVALDHGEMVLSDGRHEIRARCGNLVSDGPHLEALLLRPGYPPMLGIASETGSPSTAAGGGLIETDGTIGLGSNPGSGGSLPNPTSPGRSIVSPGQPGSSDSGSPGGAGGGGGSNAGGSGGGHSGDTGDSANAGSSGGGSSENGGDGRSGPGGGSSNSDDPGAGSNQGGPGPSGGDSPSSPNSNPEGPGTGNPGGPGGTGGTGGTGPTGTDKPGWVLVAEKDGYRDEPVAVPEPTSLSLWLLGAGAAALAGRRTRKR